MNKLYGSHPGFRANHAKGIVVEGSFTPTPAAAALSKASVFQGSPVPVTVRFSNFVDPAGRRQPFRFQFLPVAGAEHLSKADAASKTPDFLMDELPSRLAKEPVKFRVVAQLANPGDQTKDPAQPWPDDRRTVDLGTIALTAAVADSASAQKALLYLPNNVPDGIEPSDDPLIDTRVQAYAVSSGRRSQ